MKILHYALGFPPYRSGGLTKYCMDLMNAQREKGHEVAMMWPGKFTLAGHFVRFKKGKKIKGIGSFEVVNPLLVPLDEGIEDVNLFMEECSNPEVYRKFLENYEPDVIHIHTLMGLHKEFVEIARSLGIKVIFTTHDYFGICPKVTLFREGAICQGNCEDCPQCNQGALSVKKIKILQSSLYRVLKDSSIVKKLRHKHRQEFFDQEKVEQSMQNVENIDDYDNNFADYERLREYYISILKNVDEIHFNSSVTEKAYRQFIPEGIKGKVINISHNNIKDNRRKKTFEGKLKITYMAPPKPFKGFLILRQALEELWQEGIRDFELNIYSNVSEVNEFINVHESFHYSQLEEIFDGTDMLVAPSVWYETFGFTVLEALSFGVPVMVSTNVGAKDLLDSARFGMVIEPTKEAVKQAVKYVVENREILSEYNQRIVKEMDLCRVINSADEIEKMYREK